VLESETESVDVREGDKHDRRKGYRKRRIEHELGRRFDQILFFSDCSDLSWKMKKKRKKRKRKRKKRN